MGFFSWLFRRQKEYDLDEPQTNELETEDTLSVSRDGYDIKDPDSRKKFIVECLTQMAEASDIVDQLREEYDDVTDYLSDLEIIEDMPQKDANELLFHAKKVKCYRQEEQKFRSDPTRLNDSEFQDLERIAKQIPTGINKIMEAEEYQRKIKSDLKKIDNERSAYRFRSSELHTAQNNMRGISYIVIGAMILSIIILCVLQFAMNLDSLLGFLIVALAGTVCLVVIHLRYEENEEELKRIHKTANKLIRLQNKVKIRYVNNTNLLDYLYAKFEVNSERELRAKWDLYQSEADLRKKREHSFVELDVSEREVHRILKQSNLKHPERFLKQVDALTDEREMTEIRHNLIVRRSKLRKQLEYNQTLAENANTEIESVVKQYPQYAEEILDLVNSYEHKVRF